MPHAREPSRLTLSVPSISRRRRYRDFHRRPFHHLLIEGVELRVGLAPAAIGKAEIGIAEHADEADLGDVERPGQYVRLVLEARHAGPCAVPVIIGPCLPTQW